MKPVSGALQDPAIKPNRTIRTVAAPQVSDKGAFNKRKVSP